LSLTDAVSLRTISIMRELQSTGQCAVLRTGWRLQHIRLYARHTPGTFIVHFVFNNLSRWLFPSPGALEPKPSVSAQLPVCFRVLSVSSLQWAQPRTRPRVSTETFPTRVDYHNAFVYPATLSPPIYLSLLP
jgi:hypothetical protein